MKREEIIITNDPNVKEAQVKVVLFPEKRIKARKDKYEQKITDEIDIMELCLKDMDNNEMKLQMTPDEALDICSLLNSAVNLYLNEFNKEYKKLIRFKVAKLNKRRKKLKK